MKNSVQPGNNLDLPAPYDVKSGEGALIGSFFGVASVDAKAGETIAFATDEVYDLPKAPSQAWTPGVKVYWDAANKRCTTVAAGSVLIGGAVQAVAGGAGDTTGRVKLNGTTVV